MEIEHCLQCGSSDIHLGVLSQDYVRILPILWKSQSSGFLGDAVVNGILCKFCGHIKLVADSEIIGPKSRQKWLYCKAVYSYHKKNILEEEVVYQNCQKPFQINHSEKTDDIIDAIEKGLREE
ncbi:MAG: hypothetical protein ACTSSE_03720 [Candidatus Thorarchaeota archaeon]